jgi:hypothetical protein
MREQIREALNKHWHASAASDANAEHDIYDENAVFDYPQSGERIPGAICWPCGVILSKPSGFNVANLER